MTSYVFSNFAVSTLQADLLASATTCEIEAGDVGLFPTLPVGDYAFPVTFADTEGNVEIAHVTASVGGVWTLLRGREDTTARDWPTGTLVQHTFTAGTLGSLARLVPLGEWNSTTTYHPGDLVTRADRSYVATDINLNQGPPGASWQLLYDPGSSGALAWKGAWNAVTEYTSGDLVSYQGIVWRASTTVSSNIAPAFGSAYWQGFSQAGVKYDRLDVLPLTGTNAYVSTEEVELFDGLVVRVAPTVTNTGAVTLQLGSNAPRSVATSEGSPLQAGYMSANRVFDLVYRGAFNRFDGVESPGTSWRLGVLESEAKGVANMTATVKAVDGTVTLPGITFASDQNNGIRRSGSNAWRLVAGGTDIVEISPSGVRMLVSSGVPVGTVVEFAGSTAPNGWLQCYGQILNVADYPELAAVLGAAFGGDGVTTFGIPDDRGRVAAGADDMGGVAAGRLVGWNAGTASGSATVTLSVGNLPAHDHNVQFNIDWPVYTYDKTNYIVGSGGASGNPQNIVSADPYSATSTNDPATTSYNFNTANTGSGTAFSIVQPTIARMKIIKARPYA